MNFATQLTGNATWATSLQYRDFRIVWGSTLLYSLGTGMEQVAIGWLVFELTESPFMVGVASAARMAPFFFLGALSGVVADWVDRRSLLKFITLGGSLVSAGMALLLLLGPALVGYVIALVIAGGCFMAFALTTRQAITYDIVGPEHALNGLSLTTLSMQAGGIAGAVLSGALIQVLGPGWQYVAVSSSYLASFAVLLAMRATEQEGKPRAESPLRMVAGYFQLIQQNQVLLVLMLLASATEVFGFAYMTLLPVFAKDVLQVGPMGLGVLTAVRQGGGLLGLSLLASLRNYRRKGVLLFVVAGGFGLGLMAFS
ncbi:MAG: MFS transporter, partial [Dehalococcoidia bacterium]